MNPVQSLQHMLDQLARTDPTLPRLIETGTFDEPTLEAVMIFQRDHGLPVTGIADQRTWDAISAAYFRSLFRYGAPPPLHVFPSGTNTVKEGELKAELAIVQAMLSVLSKVISEIEAADIDGINSGATQRNLRYIQSLSGLSDSNGVLDRATWAILSHLYRALITRQAYRNFSL